MDINDSVHRWEAYTQLFQKLVDTFEDDVLNDNTVDVIETVFMCNLYSLLVAALNISERALGVAKFTKEKIQKEKEQEV